MILVSIGAHLLAHNGHQKLFQKAILQSGTALQVFPAILDSQAVFDKLLNATKCSQARDTIGCLQQVPAEILLNATASDSFSIVMDGVYVQRQPVESYLRELFSRVPLLIGTNTDEGTYFTYNAVKSTEDIDKYYDATVPFLNGTQRSQLMQLYPSSSYSAPYLAAADVTGDRLFQCPSKLMARVYADAGLRVFKYHWNYPVTPPPPFNGNVSLGVFHFSEVPFVFNIQSLFRTPEEFNLSRILNAFWIQFVVQGNPNPRQEPFDGLNDQLWPLYNAFSGYQQIVFQAPVEAITLEEDRSREEKCLFWDLVGQSLMYSKTTSTRS